MVLDASEYGTRNIHDAVKLFAKLTGVPYEELPNCYVLFICDFDPFKLKKYRLQASIGRIKSSREMGERYMLSRPQPFLNLIL